MLLRMTLVLALMFVPAVNRFNEAGAMLLRMTGRSRAVTLTVLVASMRPEQCCSG